MLPRVSKLHQQGNREEILLLMLRSWHKLAAAIIPLTGVLYAVGYEFITVFYTQRYQASWPIFALNLAVLLLGMMITDAVVRGHPEIRSWMFITRFVGIVVQIGVSLLTIPVFGMIGALLGIVVAGVVDRIIMLTVLFRLLGFGPRHLRALSGIAGFALGSVVAAAAAITVKWLVHGYPPMVRLVCGAATFGVIYVITVLKMDVLNADEKAVLNRYLRKLPGCRSLQVS
jgi:O-antigen/teichoic acid export membrane protein